ncbi:hypothetical protein CEXT_673031 [Caerostris extrusa]|uniref:Uncharacterized protein n=1 Tax=Caerostris extrusa TaxID=172846 RepID=A0AAV4VY77_CAEEX|nr:hypothetical protein CEXT_673031 [Caerostris extrusa]
MQFSSEKCVGKIAKAGFRRHPHIFNRFLTDLLKPKAINLGLGWTSLYQIYSHSAPALFAEVSFSRQLLVFGNSSPSFSNISPSLEKIKKGKKKRTVYCA